jgi:hypothetical protein
MAPWATAASAVCAVLVFALCVVAACDSDSSTVRGSGTIVTQAREVQGFGEIRLEGSGGDRFRRERRCRRSGPVGESCRGVERNWLRTSAAEP